MYLGDDLELLALAKLGLGDSLFDALDGLVVEFLLIFSHPNPSHRGK